MVTVSEVDSKKEESKEKEPVVSHVKLFGYFEYRKGIALAMSFIVLAVILVCFSFEDQQRDAFLAIAAFNSTCLIVAWIMRNQMDVRAQKRADEREKKAEWDALPESEKMARLSKLLPGMSKPMS